MADNLWLLLLLPLFSREQFLLELGIGTPAQLFLATIDTGSPYTWVYSSRCCFTSNHSYFKPERSSTFANRTVSDLLVPQIAKTGEQEPQQFKMEYGSGNNIVAASMAYDVLSLIPDHREQLLIPTQTLGLVVNISDLRRGSDRDSRSATAMLGWVLRWSSRVILRC